LGNPACYGTVLPAGRVKIGGGGVKEVLFHGGEIVGVVSGLYSKSETLRSPEGGNLGGGRRTTGASERPHRSISALNWWEYNSGEQLKDMALTVGEASSETSYSLLRLEHGKRP